MTIYFIKSENTGYIKIGYTAANAERRMAQLQTGQPEKLKLLGTMPGNQSDERNLHKEFSDRRINGEWFSAEIISIVEHLIDKQGPWYLCRGPELLRKRMEMEWISVFGKSVNDGNTIQISESNLNSSVRKVRGFEKAKRKFKKRFNYIPKRPHPFYQIIDGIDDDTYKVASYILAFENNSLG